VHPTRAGGEEAGAGGEVPAEYDRRWDARISL